MNDARHESIGSLVSGLGREAVELLKSEVGLVKAEASARSRLAARSAVPTAIAMACILVAFQTLVLAAGVAVSRAFEGRLDLALAATGATVLTAGVISLLVALRRIRQAVKKPMIAPLDIRPLLAPPGARVPAPRPERAERVRHEPPS